MVTTWVVIWGSYFNVMTGEVKLCTENSNMLKLEGFAWFIFTKSKGRSKAVNLKAWSGPEGSRDLRLKTSWQRHRMVVRLSALHTGRLYPQEIILLLISVRGWVNPWGKGFMPMKNQMISTGIEPATFRFVAQHLNHCATAFPIPLWGRAKRKLKCAFLQALWFCTGCTAHRGVEV